MVFPLSLRMKILPLRSETDRNIGREKRKVKGKRFEKDLPLKGGKREGNEIVISFFCPNIMINFDSQRGENNDRLKKIPLPRPAVPSGSWAPYGTLKF
jgi:hypothetical protein